MSKKEVNDNIAKKREHIIEYYDKKINEIEKMEYEDFIINYLNKEKKRL